MSSPPLFNKATISINFDSGILDRQKSWVHQLTREHDSRILGSPIDQRAWLKNRGFTSRLERMTTKSWVRQLIESMTCYFVTLHMR